MKIKRTAPAVTCIALVLCGCGFHLRERPLIPAHVESIHVTAVNAYGDLVRRLRQELELLGVTPVAGDAKAEWRLHIGDERNTRKALTTTSLISVAEYELRLEVEFELLDERGEHVIPPTSVAARRIYVLDRTSLAASSEEEALLRREMQAELVSSILRRVGTVTARSERTSEDQPEPTGD